MGSSGVAPNCSGNGDSSAYDALGRIRSLTHSDGSAVLTDYNGPAVDVKDEGNGTRSVERISQVDGLGRLQYVCEVTNASQQGGGAPGDCQLDYSGTGFKTTYAYNGRGDLTAVTQGALSRGFNSDMLSRLTSAYNPETGTITYAYDSDSNCAQSSYPGELISKTDARGIRTCFQHDNMHRLTAKSYSDGVTPAVTYNYGETSKYGRTLTDTVGRKSSESTAGPNPTGEVFSYDAMGHVIDNSQCTPQNCGNNAIFPVTYPSYNVLGSPFSETNGAGVTINYGYNSAGMLYSVTSSLSDGNHPGTLYNNAHYNPLGLLTSAAIGPLPLTETHGYSTQRPGWQGWLSSTNVEGPSSQSTTSITVNGSEGSRQTSPAVAGTGSVSISGNEQSTVVQTSAASRSSVAIQVSGSEQSFCTGECLRTIYDTGSVSITVNGCTTSTTYGKGSTSNGIANSLYVGFSCGTVTASLSGTTITFTSVAYGSNTNYGWSTSSHSNYESQLGGASFCAVPPGWGFSESASGSMSGGADATYMTVYDSGTATITVNGHGDAYSWGNGSSASSIASGLASAINGDGGAAASASASGATVYLTAKTVGSGTNYSLSSSTSWNASYFGSSSFALSNSGASLTGGVDASWAYDSGTVTIVANGTSSSASYGQGSTNTSVASALASAVTANNPSVTASASGNVVTLTSRTQGANTNYAFSDSSSGSFSPASFTASPAGGNMSGGTGVPLYTLGLSYFNNGDLNTASDSVNGNWTYSYDDFNRLNTALAPNVAEGCLEAYDQYGNRWSQSPYGAGNNCSGFNASFTGNNNRVDSSSYDASGNLLNDGTYSYTYDAENRITQVNENRGQTGRFLIFCLRYGAFGSGETGKPVTGNR